MPILSKPPITRISLHTPRDLVGVPLSGGLGNQMFQYAAALAVAERSGGRLYFDLRYFLRADARPLELPAFGLDLPQWVPTLWRVDRLGRAVSGDRWRPGPERVVQTRDLEPRVLTVGAPCNLRGFFQSEQYFDGIKDLVRSRFDTTPLASDRTASLERQMQAVEKAVVVHLRRGDYGGNRFPRIGAEHYSRARAEIERRVERPTYFLFSDDISEATSALADWPNLVPVTGLTGLDDFRLMSLGRHFLIANSTYSWWAAWLGRAADKIVVAPTTWYGPEFDWPIDLDARLPREWLRV